MSELLPLRVRNKLISEYPEWYKDDYSFEWSYCSIFGNVMRNYQK